MTEPDIHHQGQEGRFETPSLSGEQVLEHLFTCRPNFTKLPGFEGSNGTRDPAQYDMHLHDRLILKDVVYFPDMLDQLADTVASIGNTEHLPQLSLAAINSPLHPAYIGGKLGDKRQFRIGHEATLQAIHPTVQQFSSVAASTLFAGFNEWSNIFKYSDKPISMMPCALADGYLSLDGEAIAKARLPKELDNDLKLVIKQGLSDFLFWELKSINAGSEEVMQAIRHLAGAEFPWVRCPQSRNCGAGTCKKMGNRFKFSVTGHQTGEDGDIMGDEPGASMGNQIRFDKSGIDFSVTPVPDSRGWKFRRERKNVQKKSKGKRRLDDDPDEEDGESGGNDVNDDGADDGGGTLPFTQSAYSKAKKIVQQIWAEAVNVDATFIVLNAASREYIGIRDRKLQRLYLSPLIDLDKPATVSQGYFKIHTGLRITALLDAIQRAKRLDIRSELYTFQYDRAEPYKDKPPNTAKTARLSRSAATPRDAKAETEKSPDGDEDDAAESSLDFTPAESQLWQGLQDARSLKISWNVYTHGLGPAGSMIVARSVKGPLSHTGTPMELHVIHPYPQSSISYSCYAQVGDTILRGIVIKVAPPGLAKEGLIREHKMYNALSRFEDVAQSLGLVKHFGVYRERHEAKTVLVLLDGGDLVCAKSKKGIPDSVYSQVKKAVQKMHLAKITHGSLAPENILVTKDDNTKKGQWNIHFISWKNGKYHKYLSARKVCNGFTLERSARRIRKPPLKVRPSNSRGPLVGKGKEEHGTDKISSRTRKIKPRVFKRSVKPATKLFMTFRIALRKWNEAVEEDRRMLNSNMWNRHQEK
ncbi:hypothetical protein EDD18DRAFT_79015 [Armillaria luteobubalina]|uniref:Protein kinase domain-containing protein n=1 Tax=Armillaria luteobubalina TaxID=153913 RepID=A0AA39QA68_9AGAR|nr:hypothetical protein EDD18DRAFT_79015 [Armillaria luteobubalina]